MSEGLRDCDYYVRRLIDTGELVGEAKGYGWHTKMGHDRERAMEEADSALNLAMQNLHMFKDIVPEHMIESFEKAVEKRDYDEMMGILETVALYVTMFCRGRLKARA